jgi:putative oxidoreductase
MGIWRFLLRLTVGSLFIGHGTQKLFGWFGGQGIGETARGFEQLGLRPGRHHAVAAGLTEAAGGALIASGYELPLGAALLTGSSLTAIKRVHLKNGPWTQNGGYEYNLVLVLSLLALVECGPGKLSLDSALKQERSGFLWATAAAAGGALGALAVDSIAERKLPQIHVHAPHLTLFEGNEAHRDKAAA